MIEGKETIGKVSGGIDTQETEGTGEMLTGENEMVQMMSKGVFMRDSVARKVKKALNKGDVVVCLLEAIVEGNRKGGESPGSWQG